MTWWATCCSSLHGGSGVHFGRSVEVVKKSVELWQVATDHWRWVGLATVQCCPWTWTCLQAWRCSRRWKHLLLLLLNGVWVVDGLGHGYGRWIYLAIRWAVLPIYSVLQYATRKCLFIYPITCSMIIWFCHAVQSVIQQHNNSKTAIFTKKTSYKLDQCSVSDLPSLNCKN